MASKAPSSSSSSSSKTKNGKRVEVCSERGDSMPEVTNGFYKLGEIRPPRDEDFDHFLQLADSHDNWTLKHDKNGVKVWMRDIPGETVKMLKVYCHFKTITGQVLYDTIQDSDYRTQWDEALINDRTICLVEGTDSDLCYYSMKCPNPLRNRDFVYQRCWRVIEGMEYITFNHSVGHELYPPNSQFIRGISRVTGCVIRETSEGCTASYVTHSDPRGKVPKWLLNIVACKIAPRIFLKIAQAAERYPDWKSKNRPDHKPWTDPTKYGIPIASISSLSQFTEDTIPLTPRAGEPDYLGAEEQLVEDSDNVPDGLAIDPVLLANGGEEKKEEEKVGGNGSNGISDVIHHNDTHS